MYFRAVDHVGVFALILLVLYLFWVLDCIIFASGNFLSFIFLAFVGCSIKATFYLGAWQSTQTEEHRCNWNIFAHAILLSLDKMKFPVCWSPLLLMLSCYIWLMLQSKFCSNSSLDVLFPYLLVHLIALRTFRLIRHREELLLCFWKLMSFGFISFPG